MVTFQKARPLEGGGQGLKAVAQTEKAPNIITCDNKHYVDNIKSSKNKKQYLAELED